jgi:hypothetical protein
MIIIPWTAMYEMVLFAGNRAIPHTYEVVGI